MYWNDLVKKGIFHEKGWIVTLDVLKYLFYINVRACKTLNSNIRCIEISLTRWLSEVQISWIVTLDVLKFKLKTLITSAVGLNSNIRCIEIKALEVINKKIDGWIVTLDVLKF